MRAELKVGDVIPSRRFSIDGHGMRIITLLTGDPNPIHFDPDAVERLGLGRRPVNQGVINMAYPINAVIDWLGTSSRIRSVRVRFLGNTFDGDEVEAGGVVSDIDRTGTDVTATLDIWLDVPSGDRALEGTVVVELR